jgi:hypothetical protein
MSIKYPNNVWQTRNGENYVDENGEITETANNWLTELNKLSAEQIRHGINNLDSLGNPAFPPTAIEFVAHCKKKGAEECAEEIFEYLQKSGDSDWWWRTETAFTVFTKLNYNPANNKQAHQTLDEIKKIYGRLDMDNLKPIPKQAAYIPYKPPSKVERDRGKFQSLIAITLMRLRPDLFLSEPTKDDYPKTTREFMQKFYETGRPSEQLVDFVCEQKGMQPDAETVQMFMPHNSNKLMVDWYKQGQPNMTDFLRTNGIAV